jgi:transcriptional regulator with XRE-family HTH domain
VKWTWRSKLGGVRGDLLRWARMQRGLTMRELRELTGIAPSYLSELENGRYREPSSAMIARLGTALGVTEAFLRGEIPHYTEDRDACKGLAADVGAIVRKQSQDWARLGVTERMRRVLEVVANQSQRLPRVVFAYVARMELSTLEAFIAGEMLITRYLVDMLGDVTLLPQEFFRTGRLNQSDLVTEYEEVLARVKSLGIQPAELMRLIDKEYTS